MNSSENDYNFVKFGANITPIYLSIKDKENPKYRSRCNSMTLDFGDASIDVHEIIFKNYYTYAISMLVMKTSCTDSNRFKKWYIAIQKKKLMDNPHLECQSQDCISIKSSESKIDWLNLSKIKLIMCQPSPNWKHFGLDDIKVLSKTSIGKHKDNINKAVIDSKKNINKGNNIE